MGNNTPTLVITLTVTFLVIAIFRQLKPTDVSEFQTDKTLVELRKKYLKYDLMQLGLLFGFTIILTFIYYKVLVAISDFNISTVKESVIVVKPFIAAWFLSAMFTAMLTATVIIVGLTKWKLKADWIEYTAYGYLKAGFSPRVGTIVIKVFAIITGLLLIGFLDWFTAFRQNDIIVNSLFGLGNKTYLYSDIIDIRDIDKLKAPNGNIVEDKHYIIVFNDGSKWNSRNSGFGDYKSDTRIMDVVENKTGRQLTKLEFDSD
jgi:hypothetical protein